MALLSQIVGGFSLRLDEAEEKFYTLLDLQLDKGETNPKSVRVSPT